MVLHMTCRKQFTTIRQFENKLDQKEERDKGKTLISIHYLFLHSEKIIYAKYRLLIK